MSLAIAVVGERAPDWVSALPAEVHLADRAAVEVGLNRALERTGAPFLLPVQAEDRLRPEGVLALLAGLRGAPSSAVAAVAPAEQVRRDGGVRLTPATPAAGRQALLALGRIATPVLFRTGALRQAGGWRPGEAGWTRRAFRHRGLLARLLEQGSLIGVDHLLGVVALPNADAGGELLALLNSLLYRPVRITTRSPRAAVEGRVAAVTPALLTLASPGGQVILLPVERVAAVAMIEPEAPAASPPPPTQRPVPEGARIVTRVWGPKPKSWP